jgi:hypothetical protein
MSEIKRGRPLMEGPRSSLRYPKHRGTKPYEKYKKSAGLRQRRLYATDAVWREQHKERVRMSRQKNRQASHDCGQEGNDGQA